MSAEVAPTPRRRKRINFARLNHILIPRRSEERDRYRRGLAGHALRPLAWIHGAFTREGRALVGIALMVGVAGLDVGNSQVYLLWAALSGLLLGSLLARPLYGMRGARLRVFAPRRATAHEPVHFDLEVEAEASLRAVRVEMPFLPWDGRWLGRPPGIAGVEAGAPGRTRVAARFVERGEHHLDPFSARAMVPFGIAAGSAVRSGACRFLVLPRAAHVADFALAEGGASDRRRVASHVMGTSGDLAGVRPYRPGDPIRHLHARTWARTGIPHVREHVRERNERAGVVLVVDRESDEKLVEAAVSLAAGVVSAVSRSPGGLGLVVLGSDAARTHNGAAPSTVIDETMDRLAVFQPPARLDAEATIAAITAQLADVSSLVVIATEGDQAPGAPSAEVASVVAALERTGLGVRVLVVVQEDVVAKRGEKVAGIGRAAIESGVEIRL